jgi:hypothetical protein
MTQMAASSLTATMTMPIAPQQRQPPSLSPRLRQYGGSSRVCRRLLWRKIRHWAAVPVLAADHFGGNSANTATKFFLLFTFYYSIQSAGYSRHGR